MNIGSEDLRLSLDSIRVEDRARQKITQEEIQELAESILRHTPGSLLHPIVVEPVEQGDSKFLFRLVAGERRFRAYQWLSGFAPEYKTIPARLTSSLSLGERRVLELEENIKRKDLFWQDYAIGVLKYYEALSDEDGEPPSTAYLAGKLNISDTVCKDTLQVARALQGGDKRISSADSVRSAASLLRRDAKRTIENELLSFGETERRDEEKRKREQSAPKQDKSDLDLDIDFGPDIEKEPTPPYSLFTGTFEEFLAQYTGDPFNFVHCDFPYGLNIESSMQLNAGKYVNYNDDPATFDKLMLSLASAVRIGVISKTAHIMFWFPMLRYSEIVQTLRSWDVRVNDYPLVWVKSDKAGIVPDHVRYPRRIYETALLCSLGDRKIIKPLFNASIKPSSKADSPHMSYKPREMLLDFLPMFIDSDSRVLDPTCGSGSALGVALELGANYVVGVDTNSECIELSTNACRTAIIRRGV